MMRPTNFDPSVAENLLARLRDGETLTSICYDSSMPSTTTIWKWRHGFAGAPCDWQDEYARARQDQADGLATDILGLSDSLDEKIRESTEQAIENITPEQFETPAEFRRAVNKAEFFAKRRTLEAVKLMVSTRQWVAGRMNPKNWGDRVTHEVTTDKNNPPRIDFSNVPTNLLERIAEIEEQLRGGSDKHPDNNAEHPSTP